MMEAGLPAGILNVVQGDKDCAEAILRHPEVKAVSFVGSSDVAESVVRLATASGKRVQAMGGAKNHGIVMPDADLEQTTADILGAAYGSAGQRCMALPVVVPVGEPTALALREMLLSGIKGLKIGVSTDPKADYGPLVSAQHRTRVERYIAEGVQEGAELVVDGRGFTLAGHEGGFFLGPSLFDRVKPHMRSYQDEIFGPVLQIVRVGTLAEAIGLPSRHQYGNGVAIFTRDGHAAREFANEVEVGMVGINIPIPVPVAYHSFGGWKRSNYADLNQYGLDSVRFFTRTKIVTQRWPRGGAVERSFVIPIMR
jgi:malonate-semialdehyde dehydrogenase (acetylating)/methylmalonate-semialdehyde dehydrogenase